MYRRNVLLDRFALASLDALGVVAAALAAVWLRHSVGVGGARVTDVAWGDYLLAAIVAACVFVALLAVDGFYRSPLPRVRLVPRLLKTAAFATAVLLVVSFFYRGFSYSRVSVLLFLLLSVPALVVARMAHRTISARLRGLSGPGRRVAIIGTGPTALELGGALREDPTYLTLVGYIDDRPGSREPGDGSQALGSTRDLTRIVNDHSIDEIIIATPSSSRERQQELMGLCMAMGLHWRLVPDLAGLLHHRVDLDVVGGLPVVGIRGTRVVGYNWALKRAFDLVVASVSLIVLSPVMLLAAAGIKATSKGPVLYRQDRLGFEGRQFTLLKFRSMKLGAEPEVHELYTSEWILGRSSGNGENGADPKVHKLTEDERITPIGRFLRATSIDELPQLWNVLAGDMSIVGPRPPLPYEVARYTEAHKRRFEALPGITGLWQVSGRNRLSFEEMVRLDVSYIENWSLSEDVRIVMRTVPAMLTGRGH